MPFLGCPLLIGSVVLVASIVLNWPLPHRHELSCRTSNFHVLALLERVVIGLVGVGTPVLLGPNGFPWLFLSCCAGRR